MTKESCENCGESTYGMVTLTNETGQARHLCNSCHNEEMANLLGIDNFDDYQKNYQAKDISGKLRTFYIQKKLFPLGVKWIAYETRNGKVLEEGYQFLIYAELEENPRFSLQRLLNKINKGLSVKYIKQKRFEGQVMYTLPLDKLVGRIEWDDDFNGQIPKIIVDGNAYTWQQIGRMLMGYEGWNLKLEISEEGED